MTEGNRGDILALMVGKKLGMELSLAEMKLLSYPSPLSSILTSCDLSHQPSPALPHPSRFLTPATSQHTTTLCLCGLFSLFGVGPTVAATQDESFAALCNELGGTGIARPTGIMISVFPFFLSDQRFPHVEPPGQDASKACGRETSLNL